MKDDLLKQLQTIHCVEQLILCNACDECVWEMQIEWKHTRNGTNEQSSWWTIINNAYECLMFAVQQTWDERLWEQQWDAMKVRGKKDFGRSFGKPLLRKHLWKTFYSTPFWCSENLKISLNTNTCPNIVAVASLATPAQLGLEKPSVFHN